MATILRKPYRQFLDNEIEKDIHFEKVLKNFLKEFAVKRKHAIEIIAVYTERGIQAVLSAKKAYEYNKKANEKRKKSFRKRYSKRNFGMAK